MHWSKVGFGLIVIILIGFIIGGVLDKKEVTVDEDYLKLNRGYIGYDSASKIAEKVKFLVNIRTSDDYARLEKEGATYLNDSLYQDLIKGKPYADKYVKDVVEITDLRGHSDGNNKYVFKAELMINKTNRTVYLIHVDGGIITKLRSLGDV